MDEKKKREMFAFMSGNDDGEAPDGAWQQMLEDAAEEWGRQNGIEIDGFDAFMEYIDQSENYHG